MRKNFSSILLELPRTDSAFVSFDQFGNNLMAAQGHTIKLFSGKTWMPHTLEQQLAHRVSKFVFAKQTFVAYAAFEGGFGEIAACPV